MTRRLLLVVDPLNVSGPRLVSPLLFPYLFISTSFITLVPKVSYKKPKVKLRGGVDSDEGMEPVDETTLVSSGGGHPV
jgi:hypothetical protein